MIAVRAATIETLSRQFNFIERTDAVIAPMLKLIDEIRDAESYTDNRMYQHYNLIANTEWQQVD